MAVIGQDKDRRQITSNLRCWWRRLREGMADSKMSGSGRIRKIAAATSIATGLIGSTAVISANQADALAWFSNGDGYGSVFAFMCDNGICFGSWHQVRQIAEVYSESTASITYTFEQDRFGTIVSGIGRSSVFGGCITIGIDHVKHTSPTMDVWHEHDTWWPVIGSSNDVYSSYYTSTYKESGVHSPTLQHATYLYDNGLVCPIPSPPLFTQTYKR